MPEHTPSERHRHSSSRPPVQKSSSRKWWAVVLGLLTLAGALVLLVSAAIEPESAAGTAAAGAEDSAPPAPRPLEPPKSVFASPDGRPDADGSQSNPIDLTTALSEEGPVRPGDTLWLLDGVYRGSFVAALSGVEAAPIYIKQFPGGRAILDGAGSLKSTLAVTGSDVWLWGFEITNSDPERVFDRPSGGDTRRATGLSVAGARDRLINLVIHDADTAVSMSEKAAAIEIYGCIIYNNGVSDPRGAQGSGLVIEGTPGANTVTDLITFNNQSVGVSASGERLERLRIDGLVSFNNGRDVSNPNIKLSNLSVSSTARAGEFTLSNSHLYHAPDMVGPNLILGSAQVSSGVLTVDGNTIGGGSGVMSAARWAAMTVTNNLMYLRSTADVKTDQIIAQVRTSARPTSNKWTGNTYVDQTSRGYAFAFNDATNSFGGGNLNFAEWQKASTFDGASTYSTTRPQGTKTYVRPNRYEPGRAHIVVYNWDKQAKVSVSLDNAGLARGDAFEVVDALDPLGRPVLAATFADSTITLDLSNLSAQSPIGGLPVTPPHTAPEFAVFVVRKAAARATTTNAAPPAGVTGERRALP